MRVMLVRPGALGDTLLTLPLLRALLTQADDLHITFVGNAAVLPLISALGLADETSDYQDRRWTRLFHSAGFQIDERAEARWDRALCLLRDPEGIVERNLCALGIPRVTLAPGRPHETARQHIVAYLAQVAQTTLPPCEETLPFVLPDSADSHGDPRTIAIHPGSGGVHKCWPVEHFAVVIRELWTRNIPVLLLAGPAEQERLVELLKLLPQPPVPTLLTVLQNVPLLDVAQRLQLCSGYVGNDTGPTHLAALLGLPTLALFGPTDPLVWRPPGPRVTVLRQADMVRIQPEMVLEILQCFSARQ